MNETMSLAEYQRITGKPSKASCIGDSEAAAAQRSVLCSGKWNTMKADELVAHFKRTKRYPTLACSWSLRAMEEVQNIGALRWKEDGKIKQRCFSGIIENAERAVKNLKEAYEILTAEENIPTSVNIRIW